MKKIFLMMVMAMVSYFNIDAAPKVEVGDSFILARPKLDCLKGVWVCKLKGHADVENITDLITDRITKAIMTDLQDGTVKIEFGNQLVEKGMFYAERGEEVYLPDEVVKAFGYRQAYLVPGSYPVQPNGKYGFVIIPIKTK